MAGSLPTTCAVSCPAKIILHGEHAVVYGKAAVGASIDLRTYAILRSTGISPDANEMFVTFKMPQLDVDVTWPIKSIKSKVGTDFSVMVDALKGLVAEAGPEQDTYGFIASLVFVYLFASICGKTDLTENFSVEVHTNAPLGSGLGSSAALSVCVSALFLVLAGTIQLPSVTNIKFTISQLKEEIVGDKIQKGFFSRENLAQINNWAFAAEKIVHGTPSGIDNSLCTHGGTMVFKEGQFTALKAFPSTTPLSIVIIDSCVPKSTHKMVSAVKEKQQEMPKTFDPIFTSIDSISECCLQEFNRIIAENSIPNYKLLQDLIFINHQLLCAIGVSRPELDVIHQFAQSMGFVAKITGSGGGGCMLALITPLNENFVFTFREALSERGFKTFRTRLGVQGICYHLTQN